MILVIHIYGFLYGYFRPNMLKFPFLPSPCFSGFFTLVALTQIIQMSRTSRMTKITAPVIPEEDSRWKQSWLEVCLTSSNVGKLWFWFAILSRETSSTLAVGDSIFVLHANALKKEKWRRRISTRSKSPHSGIVPRKCPCSLQSLRCHSSRACIHTGACK